MTELDTEVVDTDVEDTEVDTDDNAEYNSDAISYEEFEQLKKDAQAKAKAEKKVVELKRQLKEMQSKTTTESNGEFVTKQELEMERFIATNPEMEEYRDELAKYQAKGISLKQAKLLVENDDETIANRKKTSSMNISRKEWEADKNTYSQEEVAKMPPEKAQAVWRQAASWKVKVI